MTEGEVHATLLRKLVGLAERLPNGLLLRLVKDAQFFYDWNLRKKSARRSARLKQGDALMRKADERYWQQFRRYYDS